jgi:hypothetical protein
MRTGLRTDPLPWGLAQLWSKLETAAQKTNVMRRNWCPKLASKLLPKTPLQFSSSNKFLVKLKNKQIAKPKIAPLFLADGSI